MYGVQCGWNVLYPNIQFLKSSGCFGLDVQKCMQDDMLFRCLLVHRCEVRSLLLVLL